MRFLATQKKRSVIGEKYVLILLIFGMALHNITNKEQPFWYIFMVIRGREGMDRIASTHGGL